MARRNDVRTDITAQDKTGKAFKSAQSNMRNLASSAAVLEGPLGQVAGRINAVGAALGRMNPLMLAGGIGISSLIVGTKVAITAAADFEEQMDRLGAILEVTGRASQVSAEQINDMARKLGEATLTSAEAARGAATAVLTFNNVRTQDLEKVLNLAQSLSVVMGGDLRANAIKLARALDNPREGLSGLSRTVLASSPAWREMVADMADAGDQAGVAAELFGRLEEKLAGIGGAGGGGLNFALDTVNERWTRLLQNLGGTATVTSTVSQAARELGLLNRFLETNMTTTDLLGEVVEGTGANVIGLAEAIGLLNEEQEAALKLDIKGWFEGLTPPEETKTDLEIVTKALRDQSQQLGRYLTLLEKAEEQGVATGTSWETVSARADGLKQSINALVDAHIRLDESQHRLSPDLVATIFKEANAQIDKFTRKALDKRDRAEMAYIAQRDQLVRLGTEGQAKLIELREAYDAYINNLDQKDIDKAQKKADKVVLIEQARLDRMKAILMQEQQDRLSPQEGGGPAGMGPSDRELEEERHNILLESLARRADTIAEAHGLESEQYRLLMEQKTIADQIHAENTRQIHEKVAKDRYDIEKSTIDAGIGLLQVLAGKNKTAAIAVIAIQKGLAIAETIMNTQVAAVRAVAELGPIAGPPAAASIQAWGAAQVGLIAATGLVQATSVGGSSASGGGGGSSGVPSRDIEPIADPTERKQVIINNYGAITSEEFVTEVIGAIAEADDSDRLSIDVQGVTAELRTV